MPKTQKKYQVEYRSFGKYERNQNYIGQRTIVDVKVGSMFHQLNPATFRTMK